MVGCARFKSPDTIVLLKVVNKKGSSIVEVGGDGNYRWSGDDASELLVYAFSCCTSTFPAGVLQ